LNLSINIGKTPPRKENQWFVDGSDGVKWLSIKDMGIANIYANTTNEGLTEEAVKKFKVKVVPKGTVVMSFKLTVGKVVILSDGMATNEAIAHFNIKDANRMSQEYIYLYLSGFNFQTLGNTSSIGNAINSMVVKAMPVLCPPEKVMSEWRSYVRELFSQIEMLVSIVGNLGKQRDLLLPKLISGNVAV
jgi:type I restriction enzyme S subunit